MPLSSAVRGWGGWDFNVKDKPELYKTELCHCLIWDEFDFQSYRLETAVTDVEPQILAHFIVNLLFKTSTIYKDFRHIWQFQITTIYNTRGAKANILATCISISIQTEPFCKGI